MIGRLARSITAHFEAFRGRSKWPFLWRISLEGLFVPLVVAVLLKLLVNLPPGPDLAAGRSLSRQFVVAVVLAPFFETLLLQCLPVMVARSLGVGFGGQLLASLVPFAALHFISNGVGSGICAGIVGGFYIAFTYVHWRQTSFRAGLWMACGTHALHDLAAVLAEMAGKSGHH